MTTPAASRTPDLSAIPAVVRADRQHLRSAARVLAAAFEDDPVMNSIIPAGAGQGMRLMHLFEAMMLSGPLEHGTVDVAIGDDGEVVGAAVWEAPHSRSLVRLPLQLPRFIRALGFRGLVRGATMLSALESARPGLWHWRLGEIGVSERARGRGVGSALLAHGLGRADTSGHPSYLESSTARNRALYRRYGFVELGFIPGLPTATPAAMLRPAQKAERGS